jgi:hypothetical protein
MIHKWLGIAVMVAFLSVPFLGCGSDAKEASTGSVSSEKTSQKSASSKSTPAASAPKTLQERQRLIRFDVSGIDVSKDEMDKLIPYARKRKLTEDDVQYVVALLKLCGVDFGQVMVSEDGEITVHSLPGKLDLTYVLSMKGGKNSSGKYCVDRMDVFFSGSGADKIKLKNGVELKIVGECGLDVLYLQEINKKVDDMFLKPETLERIQIEAVKAVQDESLSPPVVKQPFTLMASGKFDEQTKKVVFQNEIFVDVAFERKSEVYGGAPEKETKTISFDFDGNVLKK